MPNTAAGGIKGMIVPVLPDFTRQEVPRKVLFVSEGVVYRMEKGAEFSFAGGDLSESDVVK